MSERFRWPLVVVPSAILMAFLLAVDADGPIRVLPAVWFLLFCPGLSFVWLLPMRSPAEDLAVGLVLSIVIDTLVATALAASSAALAPRAGSSSCPCCAWSAARCRCSARHPTPGRDHERARGSRPRASEHAGQPGGTRPPQPAQRPRDSDAAAAGRDSQAVVARCLPPGCRDGADRRRLPAPQDRALRPRGELPGTASVGPPARSRPGLRRGGVGPPGRRACGPRPQTRGGVASRSWRTWSTDLPRRSRPGRPPRPCRIASRRRRTSSPRRSDGCRSVFAATSFASRPVSTTSTSGPWTSPASPSGSPIAGRTGDARCSPSACGPPAAIWRLCWRPICEPPAMRRSERSRSAPGAGCSATSAPRSRDSSAETGWRS